MLASPHERCPNSDCRVVNAGFLQPKVFPCPPKPQDPDAADSPLTKSEKIQLQLREDVGNRVVHEAIRRSGDEELHRPLWSLWWSGFAAGCGIFTSVLGEALLDSVIPPALWRIEISSLGYTLVFLIVVLGRLQLFTESTLQAVIPVASEPIPGNFVRLFRLWGIVLLANIAGTFFTALLISNRLVGFEENLGRWLRVFRPVSSLRRWPG